MEADASEANRIETATEAASVHGQHQITNIQPHVETVEMNGNVLSADNSVDGAHSNLHCKCLSSIVQWLQAMRGEGGGGREAKERRRDYSGER